jgi:hypothetical protein
MSGPLDDVNPTSLPQRALHWASAAHDWKNAARSTAWVSFDIVMLSSRLACLEVLKE